MHYSGKATDRIPRGFALNQVLSAIVWAMGTVFIAFVWVSESEMKEEGSDPARHIIYVS